MNRLKQFNFREDIQLQSLNFLCPPHSQRLRRHAFLAIGIPPFCYWYFKYLLCLIVPLKSESPPKLSLDVSVVIVVTPEVNLRSQQLRQHCASIVNNYN